MASIMGLQSAGGIQLSAAHGNLRGVAKVVERDFYTLQKLIVTQHTDRYDEPAFIITVSEYLAELFANLAVLYRSTASLNYDEQGRGHREWLLAQAFSTISA
uniref:tRNA pseudouridine synthase B n=1 Tax=Lygus hesperus TaxID=30085 RepID=A0A0A9XQL3_LYGHE